MPHPGPLKHNKPLTSKDWPSWRYGPNGEAQIFQNLGQVPYGWTRKPCEKFEAAGGPVCYDRQTLIDQLRDKGINPLGHWSVRYMKELIDQ